MRALRAFDFSDMFATKSFSCLWQRQMGAAQLDFKAYIYQRKSCELCEHLISTIYQEASMRTIRRILADIDLTYPLEKEVPLSKALFIDIETTGFAAKNSILYLIGCAYHENEKWRTIQWFATSYEDERQIVETFFQFASNYTHLIHFNGNNFDLPFILQKCIQYGLPYDFSTFKGIDIYRRISPLKNFLKLSNCKQKTLEQFLGIVREDLFDGGQLIDIYHNFIKNGMTQDLDTILCHNTDDLTGMFHILPILAYSNIFSDETKVKKVQANYYRDINGRQKQELFMKLSLPTPLPKEISCNANFCYFIGKESTGALKVPLYEEELKYFYSNYKDYYYLPIEDVAIHKSIASFVDKENRIQAKAQNCYTRKLSTYLPQWDVLFEPFFKREYRASELFFEVTDSLKKDRKAFQLYALHTLKMILEHQ